MHNQKHAENKTKTRRKQEKNNRKTIENRKTTTRKQNNKKQQQHNLRGILNGTSMCVVHTGTQIRRCIRTLNRSIDQFAIIYTS
jgi:hypothetical protein